jgi:hypothetical protein
MNSADLPPPEFWFYRVYSELTLALLHQVNNELTGVVFLTELIQEDMEAGAPAGDKFRDLHASVGKVIRLTQQTMDAHLPLPAEPGEPLDFAELLQDGIPMLRLVLPKTITVRIDPAPACFPGIPIGKKDFQLVLAAVGLLLSPGSSRSPGELVIAVESTPAALVFHPGYPVPFLTAEATPRPEASPAFLAIDHRLRSLGGGLEVIRNPAGPDVLRLTLPATTP